MRTRGEPAMDWKAMGNPWKSPSPAVGLTAPRLPKHLRLHNLRRRSGSSGRMGLDFWVFLGMVFVGYHFWGMVFGLDIMGWFDDFFLGGGFWSGFDGSGFGDGFFLGRGWFLGIGFFMDFSRIGFPGILWDSLGFSGDCLYGMEWRYHFVNSFSDRLRHKLPAGSNMLRPTEQKDDFSGDWTIKKNRSCQPRILLNHGLLIRGCSSNSHNLS